MAKTYKSMSNEQYCTMNSQYATLKVIAPWSIMADVNSRRENVMTGKASVRSFICFMNREIERLSKAA